MKILTLGIALSFSFLSMGSAADLVDPQDRMDDSSSNTSSYRAHSPLSDSNPHDHLETPEEKMAEPSSESKKGGKRRFEDFSKVDATSAPAAEAPAASSASMSLISQDFSSSDLPSSSAKQGRLESPMEWILDESILRIMSFLSDRDLCQLATTNCRFYSLSGTDWYDRACALLAREQSEFVREQAELARDPLAIGYSDDEQSFFEHAKRNLEDLSEYWKARVAASSGNKDQVSWEERVSLKQYYRLLSTLNTLKHEFKYGFRRWFSDQVNILKHKDFTKEHLKFIEIATAGIPVFKFLRDNRKQVKIIGRKANKDPTGINQKWNFFIRHKIFNHFNSFNYTPVQLIDWINSVKRSWNTLPHQEEFGTVFFTACSYLSPEEVRILDQARIGRIFAWCEKFDPHFTQEKFIAQFCRTNLATLTYLDGILGRMLFNDWGLTEDEKVELLKIISTLSFEELQTRTAYCNLYKECFEGRRGAYKARVEILTNGIQKYTKTLDEIASHSPSKMLPIYPLMLMRPEHIEHYTDECIGDWFEGVQNNDVAAEALLFAFSDLQLGQLYSLCAECKDFPVCMNSSQLVEFVSRIKGFSDEMIKNKTQEFYTKNMRMEVLLNYLIDDYYDQGLDRYEGKNFPFSLPKTDAEKEEAKKDVSKALWEIFFPEGWVMPIEPPQMGEFPDRLPIWWND